MTSFLDESVFYHHRQRQAQQQEIVNPRWTAFFVDVGAGGTVWPMNVDYARVKISGTGGRNYKTATSEMFEKQGARGHPLYLTGEKTSVHKPLLSAGDVTDKGHALWLDGNVGYIIQKDSPILAAMRTCFQRALRATFVEWSH